MKRILFLLCALLAFVGGAKATEVVYSTSTGSYTATNPGGTWASKWVSTATNPQVTISVGANNIQVSSGNIYSGNSGCTYTIATEAGYMITGYTIVGKAQDAAQTLTPAEGGEAVTFNTDQDYTLTVSGIATQATSFTQSTPNKGIAITSFTITVVENPDYVDPFTLLSNEKAYKLTCPRGTLGVFDNTLVSTMQGYEASNFAVLKYNEAFYLYSIAAKRFINGSALASNYNLTAVDLQLQSDGSFLLVYNGKAINNNNTGTFMSTWGVSTGTPDDGNKFTIAEVEGETFDPTEALAILANPPAVPTYTYITSADNISNEKAYIVTNARGTWNVSTGATSMTTKSAIDLEALYEQFALIKKNDLIYIYSVNAKKFLTSSNKLGDPEPVTITSTGNDSYPFFFSFDASHNINVNGAGSVLIDSYNSIDAGNSNAIIEAADFDATEAMAQLNAYLPTLIDGVAQLNLTQKDDYYGDTELGTVFSGDLTAAVTNVNSSTDITLKNVQYTLSMYGMEQTHQVGNITFAGLAVNAEGNIDDTNVSVSFADGDLDGTWEAAAHTATSATVEGTLIDGKLAATFIVVADFTQSDPGYGDYTYSLTYTITFGDELPSFEYTREGLTEGNFGTIVLNFKPEATTGIGQLYSIAGKVSDEGGNPLYIVLQEETAIEAGVPYIFQAGATTITATAPGTAASVTEPKNYEIDWETLMPIYYNNGLQGTFTATTADDQAYTNMVDNIYLLADGKIVKAAAESTLAANRAFIVMKAVPEVTGDVKGLRIYLNDTTTGIQATKSADGKTVIFNLAGQRLQNAQRSAQGDASHLKKGINIVRGKKVLVK